MDETVSEMVKRGNINEVMNFFQDPVLIDELFHTVTIRFESPEFENQKPRFFNVLPEIRDRLDGIILHGIETKRIDSEKYELMKIENTVNIYDQKSKKSMIYEIEGIRDLILQYIEIPERKQMNIEDFLGLLRRTDGRYVYGSAAICLFELYDGEPSLFPNSIDTIKCLKGLSDKNFVSKIPLSMHEKTVSNSYGEILKILRDNEFTTGVFDLRNLSYKVFGNGEKIIHRVNVIYGEGEDLGMLEKFLGESEISVSRLIYDTEEEEFIFLDDQIEEELLKKVSRYYEKPKNYYLDRFGEKRLKTIALKRILEYIERDFKIKDPGGDFFTEEGVWKQIIINAELENTNPYSIDPLTDRDKKNYLLSKIGFYGFTISRYYLKKLNLPSELIKKHFDEVRPLEKTDLETTRFSEEMDKREMKSVLKKFVVFIENILKTNKYHDYLMSGGSMLALELPDEETFMPGDLDIWINIPIDDWSRDEFSFREPEYVRDYGYQDAEEVTKNNIEKSIQHFVDILGEALGREMVVEIKKENFNLELDYGGRDVMLEMLYIHTVDIFGGTFKLQFIFTSKDIGYNIMDDFDMEFCRVALYKNKIIMDPYAQKAIKEKKSAYTPKKTEFEEEGEDLVLKPKLAKRVNKYIGRGFELSFMGKPITRGEDVRIPNGKNENLEYFFVKRPGFEGKM
jgi:hypothetical protein